MVEPGLTSRLRQHSRRSGMMVGLSMAIAIAICIAAFIWIYVRVGPILSDFIPAGAGAAATPVEQAVAGTPVVDATPQAGGAAPTTAPTQPPVTPTPNWQPTHRIASDGQNINFRSGPSTISQPLRSLPPGTELQFLGEQQGTGQEAWMHFKLEDGTEGWVRQIDVSPMTP